MLWILQIDHPYFLAWSAGMSMIASVLAFFSLLCLVPDLKEYPYYNKLSVEVYTDLMKGSDKKPGNPIEKYQSKKKLTNGPYLKDEPYISRDDEIDRRSLDMVTPSKPPRHDFFKTKPGKIFNL